MSWRYLLLYVASLIPGHHGNAEFAGVDNAGIDISARYGKGGLCRSGQNSTTWQGWTLREWTKQHYMARVDIAGVDKSA